MITDKVGGLITMFLCECLDSSKMAFIDWVQNCKQIFQFCLDHSHARNGREIQKQLKQTCRTKQRKEKRLKHKVSGYKSQSKRRSIAGCRLLLRTLCISFNPLTPKISLVILLTVCQTILIMLVWRIWYRAWNCA